MVSSIFMAASDSKWPQEWSLEQVIASDRKWPQVIASDRKWPLLPKSKSSPNTRSLIVTVYIFSMNIWNLKDVYLSISIYDYIILYMILYICILNMRYISLKMSCGIYFKWPWVRKVIDSGDHVARSETAWGALIASQSAKAPLGLGQKNWPVESHSRAGHFWWDPSVFFFFGVPNDLTLFDFHTGPYPNDGKGMEGCSLMMLAVDCFLEALCFSWELHEMMDH